MMRTIILALILMMSGLASAQAVPIIRLDVAISNDDTGKKLQGATMEILQDGAPFKTLTSAGGGKFSRIDLPIGHVYKIYFKKPGYVTKMAQIDAQYDYPEDLGEYTPMQLKPTIFEEVEGVDFGFLESTPMIEYEMNAIGILEYDPKKLKTMLKRIEDLKKQMEEQKEELEKKKAEEEQKEKDFSAYVAAGDAAVSKKDYEKAIRQYELALGIKADHTPTKNKLEDAKIKLEEMRANEAAEKAFGEKMAEAKIAYQNEELEKALTLYKEASGLKPSEQLPKDRIKEIEAKIAEQAKNQAAFEQLVADGDAAVGSENYDQAISKYEEALKLKKDSGVETKLADARKKKAAAEDAAAAEKAEQEKYDQLIAKADAAFDTEKYDEAKKNYQEALKVKPAESKPTEKIAEIERILKDRADAAAAEQKLEEDYKKLMAEGQDKINQREWDNATAKYEEALKLKPGDTEALKQIDFIGKEKAKDAAAAKLDEEYDALMGQANDLFAQKKDRKSVV